MLVSLFILKCIIILILIITSLILYKTKENYKNMALFDPLTGAYSRSYLDILKEGKGLWKEDSIATLVEIDIDKFKEINDRYGHATGDMVLRYIVDVLKESIRKEDSVIRIGGDEFIIIFNDCEEQMALSIMKRIESLLKEKDVFEFSIEFTYGIEELKGLKDIEEAMRIADTKMYDLKSKKRCNQAV